MPIAVAIAGITHWHAERYVRMLRARGVRLVGASDADDPAGSRAAARHGLGFFPTTTELLARTRPDFVVLLPRHDLAVPEVETVSGARLPMLVEKPLGRHAADARRSAAAIEAAGVFASVCFPNRHLEIWDAYRTIEAAGMLGTVIHAHFRTINGPPARYVDYGVPWMLDPARSGGGALRNLGIHGADAASTVAAGRALTLVGGRTTAIGYRGPVEDFAAAIFATGDGLLVTLEAGYSYAHMQEGGDYEWRIAATGAYLHEANGRLVVHRRGAAPEARPVRTPSVAYEVMVNAALDAFERGHPPPSPVSDCVRAVELQDAIYADVAARG